MKVAVTGIPAGMAGKVRLENVEKKDGEFGPSLFYTFIWIGSKYDGEEIGRFTPLPKAGNAGAEFLQGIIGSAVSAGTEIDFEPFIGQTYHAVTEATKKGSVRVKSVILVNAEGRSD